MSANKRLELPRRCCLFQIDRGSVNTNSLVEVLFVVVFK
jgi:hypothetical protein